MFNIIDRCEMCFAPSSRFKVLGQRLNRSQGLRPGSKSGISTSVMQCKDCGLIFSNPQPVPVDIQDHYGVAPEDYWDENYLTFDSDYFLTEIERFKELTDFRNGMKALDIGAGIGKGMKAMTRAGFDAHGLEPSPYFRDFAISKMGIDSSKLTLGSVESVTYHSGTFDFISFGAVLEHMYSPAASITRALNWLNPGGLIHIEVPSSKYFIHRLLNTYYAMVGSHYVSNLSPMHIPYHLYEFSLNSFLKNATTGGYKVVFHEYYVCPIQTVPNILKPLLTRYMRASNTGMQLCVWIAKN
jgi:2-polyprenyl-3-methyl-5-hydroxy-6-metoxy-1,4-benzoquinol methylase